MSVVEVKIINNIGHLCLWLQHEYFPTHHCRMLHQIGLRACNFAHDRLFFVLPILDPRDSEHGPEIGR